MLKAGSGDDRPCFMRSWKVVSCSCLSFLSSLLHCCKRLFLTALLVWSSWQSFRAASYIFVCRANSASTKLSSDSWKTGVTEGGEKELSVWFLSFIRFHVYEKAIARRADSVSFTSIPWGILCVSNLKAAPILLRIFGSFSPGSRG